MRALSKSWVNYKNEKVAGLKILLTLRLRVSTFSLRFKEKVPM